MQTDANRPRVLDGLPAAAGVNAQDAALETTLQQLTPRWFVVRKAHADGLPLLIKLRYGLSLMRGPMTRLEIQRARGVWGASEPW